MKNKIIIISLCIVVFTLIVLTTIKNSYSYSGCKYVLQTPGKFNLIYETNGGDNIPSESVCTGCPSSVAETLPIPKKLGWEFDGWYYDQAYTKAVTGDTKPATLEPGNTKLDENGCAIGWNDVTIYAKWIKVDMNCLELNGGGFTLNYNTNGGNSIPSESVCVACGPSAYHDLVTPVKKGYEFVGWYYDQSLTKKVEAINTGYLNKNYKYDENGCHIGYNPVTLYAKWIRINCYAISGGGFTLNYNTNGGNSIPSESVCVACGLSAYHDLVAPIKKGYEFDGWYYDQALTEKVETTNTMHLIKNYKYDENNCHIGYNPVTLYAKWKKINCVGYSGGGFTLNYNTNGGNTISSESVCVACGPSAYHDLVTPVKKGYEFEGWYYDQSLTKKVEVKNTEYLNKNYKYDENNCHIGYNPVTLYAKWKKINCVGYSGGSFTLNYNTNGGNSIQSETVCVSCGSSAYHNLTTPVKKDYEFDGWYYDQSLTKKVEEINTEHLNKNYKYDENGCHVGYNPVTLYAKWKSIKCVGYSGGSFTLNYNTNGGNSIPSETVCVSCGSSAYHDLTTPVKKGYEFDGWYYDQTLSKKVEVMNTAYLDKNYKYDENSCHIGYNPVTLYANWKSIKCVEYTGGEFTLNYNTNGGNSIPSESVCVACGPSAYHDLTNPVKKGYRFGGWYYDQSLSKKAEVLSTRDLNIIYKYDENRCHVGYDPVTLYANWIVDKTVTIKGVLIGKNNVPLANHVVELHSDVKSAVTNEQGEYIIENALEGEHELIIKDATGNEISNTAITLVYDGNENINENIIAFTDNPIELNLLINENDKLEISKNNGNTIIILVSSILVIVAIIIYIFKKRESKNVKRIV